MELGQKEFVWKIKAICLICLAGDNISLSFLTAMMFIQFLPSSPGYSSHLEVQPSKPIRICSLLAYTCAARAVVPWLQRFWPQVGMCSPGQSKQLHCLTVLGNFSGLSPYPSHTPFPLRGAIVSALSFLPRSITVPYPLSVHPGNGGLTHAPSTTKFYTPKKHDPGW